MNQRAKAAAAPRERRRPARRGMHLWMYCEGWLRFGPYEWLRLDDRAGLIRDQTGSIIARRMDDGSSRWMMNDPEYDRWFFTDPAFSCQQDHPNASRGSQDQPGPDLFEPLN